MKCAPPAPVVKDTDFADVAESVDEELPSYSLRHRHRPWVAHQKLVAVSFLGDAAVVFGAMACAYFLRFETKLRDIGVDAVAVDFRSYLGHVLFGGALMLMLLANFRLHDPRNYLAIRRTFTVIVKACSIWLIVFLGVALVLKLDPPISRMYCGIGSVVGISMLCGWRWFLYCVLRRESFARMLRQKTVFVGWNEECGRAISRLSEGRAHQIAVHGVILPPDSKLDAQPPPGVPVLGSYDSLRRIVRSSGADLIVAVDGCMDRADMLLLAETCGKEFVDFKLVPSCFQILASGLKLEYFHGMPVLGVGKLPLHHVFNNAIKRGIDIFGALVGIVLFAPLVAIFCIMVRFESRGPVFYKQRRIGLNGRPFEILKIRSMALDAEAPGRAGWTVRNDPRRLKVGTFMREWNIDELPQFINVLRGEMSLVGPRPERPELIEGFKERIPHYNVRHNIKPGVTGWAQVNGLRGDTCLRERIKFDLDYIENWNFFLDLQIIVMTFFNRSGAC
ncbi:MAG: sugar transferase [Verrucomicrobia bacterium]|nr:MAG: sugar transferase [Verrucomicrobiota bacterium]TAE87672.1 MAG: sugar transferase [Verrucomicrobiota bacterium]TAF25393.1 MAG: sugar transferase [Verrucomicrobiota bacterium]TAF41180.1 MAG: sugar transferase [Verrucomicrobiota bacterium]